MKLRPQGDTSAAIAFLRAFQPDSRWALSAIKSTGGLTGKVFDPQEREQALTYIQALNGKQNLYFSVNRVRDDFPGGKAAKKDIVEAGCLHVDIDHLEGLARLKAYPLPPSIIVFSGGGYHAYWKLSEATTDLDRVERANRQIAAELGGDHCQNVDRLLRLPGTINLPNAEKRAAGREPTLAYVVEMSMMTHSLDQFPEFSEPAANLIALNGIDLDAITPVTIEALGVALPESIRALIRDGDDLERPIGRKGARFPSRSEVVFSVSCRLALAGCQEVAIAGLLINSDYGISQSILEKKNAKKYALRQARSAIVATGQSWPDCTPVTRQPRATLRNTLVAFRRLGLVAAYDIFRRRKMVQHLNMEAFHGEMTDDISALLRRAVLDEFGFDPGKEHVRDAIHMLCLENRFHPIRDMLDSLTWDGVPRLETFLSTYLGAEDTALNRATGSIMLIAAVRRVRQPGVKFDQIIVLEGPQGSGKSTAIAILAGKENHSDQDILTLDGRGQLEMLEGVWLYEIGELEGLTRSEVGTVKAFASRSTDRARVAYGYFREDRPREVIFIGTTNDGQYLTDQTGNRRFWPVKTGRIDLAALERDRDQLWAEAAAREAAGASITLPEDLWEAAATEQSQRTSRDPWLDILEQEPGEEVHGEFVRVSSRYILESALELKLGQQKPSDQRRVAACMRLLGWDGPKTMRVKGQVGRGYERPKPDDWKPKRGFLNRDDYPA
jgi:energy-coupling factor transporter ATP-binding protein EcfA2